MGPCDEPPKIALWFQFGSVCAQFGPFASFRSAGLSGNWPGYELRPCFSEGNFHVAGEGVASSCPFETPCIVSYAILFGLLYVHVELWYNFVPFDSVEP